MRYIAVPTNGNQSSSPEEADCVRDLVNEIFASGTTWVDKHGVEHPISLQDILIIAPYSFNKAFEFSPAFPLSGGRQLILTSEMKAQSGLVAARGLSARFRSLCVKSFVITFGFALSYVGAPLDLSLLNLSHEAHLSNRSRFTCGAGNWWRCPETDGRSHSQSQKW